MASMVTIKELLDELITGDDEKSEAVAHKIVNSGPAVLPELERLFTSEDPNQRWWALRVAAEIPSETTNELLIGALGDPDVSVRQCAALGLRLNPDQRAIPGLISALEDCDQLYRSLAADALITIGEPAVSELLEVVRKNSIRARLEAIRALALIGDERAIPVLFAALEEDSALMEYWAELGLERMGVGMMFFDP